ncbi:MAG: hypothetical protein IJF92_01275 [Bacilli bacterium]|nr:hypothetical protein [Bacilli bacterium]
MKKVLYLLVIMICLCLVGCSKSTMTIAEITDIDFNKISYIKVGGALNQNENYDVERFIDEYKDLKYKKISGEYGNTAHKYFVCYDADNNTLFTIVEIGNQNKVFIKKGSFNINTDSPQSSLYQLVK